MKMMQIYENSIKQIKKHNNQCKSITNIEKFNEKSKTINENE